MEVVSALQSTIFGRAHILQTYSTTAKITGALGLSGWSRARLSLELDYGSGALVFTAVGRSGLGKLLAAVPRFSRGLTLVRAWIVGHSPRLRPRLVSLAYTDHFCSIGIVGRGVARGELLI